MSGGEKLEDKMPSLHRDTIDNELERIRQAEPLQNAGDAREGLDEPGENLDAVVSDPVTHEKFDSDPEPLGSVEFLVDAETGSPDNIACLEQSQDTYAEGSAETAHGALSEPVNEDEALTLRDHAFPTEDDVNENGDNSEPAGYFET